MDTQLLQTFLEKEFVALREEIKECVTRRFQLITLGVVGSPIISIFAQYSDFKTVSLLVPFLIVATVLLELGENNSIYRAGEYIRDVIEGFFVDGKLLGWETWLEEEKRTEERRQADRMAHVAFAIIFCFYYVIFASAGCIALNEMLVKTNLSGTLRVLSMWFMGIIYLILLVWTVWYYNANCLWFTRQSRKTGSWLGYFSWISKQ